MPRKSAAVLAAEAEAAALLSRPFADGSTDPFGAKSADEREAVCLAIAAAKLAGASGKEMRATFGERLTGPARRKCFLFLASLPQHADAGFDRPPYIGRSYDAYRDSQPRQGSRHAREHGALAEARRAEARSNAEQALAAAQAAPKGRSKASKAEHAAAVARCEATLAALA
jgi:hypothetical protein